MSTNNTIIPTPNTIDNNSRNYTQYLDYQQLPISISSNCTKTDVESILSIFQQYNTAVFTFNRNWYIIVSAVRLDPYCIIINMLFIDYLLSRDDYNTKSNQLLISTIIKQSKLIYEQSNNTTQLTDRDKYYLLGYESLLLGNYLLSIEYFTKLLFTYPTDLFIIKKLQLLYFFTGNNSKLILDSINTELLYNSNNNRLYYHSLLGFGYEENQLFTEAIEQCNKAIEISNNTDIWAIHNLAHCYHGLGELTRGIELLSNNMNIQLLSNGMSFIYTHYYFHLALFYLDLMNYNQVLQIFDNKCWLFDSNNNNISIVGSKRIERDSILDSIPIDIYNLSQWEPYNNNNKYCTDDIEGAMNLLFKYELKLSGAGSGAGSAAVTANNNNNNNNSNSNSNKPLTIPELSNRYLDICSYIEWPQIAPQGLFGLLLLHSLYQSNQSIAAQSVINTIQSNTTDRLFETIYYPIAKSIQLVFDSELKSIDIDNRYSTAYELLFPIFQFQSCTKQQLIECIGGSDEQRSILSDYYLEILFLAKQYNLAIKQAEIDIGNRIESSIPYLYQFIRNCKLNQN